MLTNQAVIFCGGLGTRLRPITDHLPKPMAPVCGRPFLEHLIEQLKENAFTEIVLLTGYLGEVIETHFGDGARFGVKITYSRGPKEWDTGRRLWEARGLMKEHFFLLYGDNYATFSRERVEEVFVRNHRLGCLSLHARSHNTNIRCAVDGKVEMYDRSRRSTGLNAVEIGYMALSARIFDFFQKPDCSFSEVLEVLSEAGELSGHMVLDVYYSISDPERLRITERYLTPKKILLMDRDGTINKKAPRGEYISQWDDFHFIQETRQGMGMLAQLGWSFIIISNQAGVGRGILSQEQIWEIDQKMVDSLAGEGISILHSYYCFHHWTDECDCRKPKPGMLLQASRDFLLSLSKTWFVGDDPRDCQAGWEASCHSAYLGKKKDLIDLPIEQQPAIVLRELSEIIPILSRT